LNFGTIVAVVVFPFIWHSIFETPLSLMALLFLPKSYDTHTDDLLVEPTSNGWNALPFLAQTMTPVARGRSDLNRLVVGSKSRIAVVCEDKIYIYSTNLGGWLEPPLHSRAIGHVYSASWMPYTDMLLITTDNGD
jgi:hypothetical protein